MADPSSDTQVPRPFHPLPSDPPKAQANAPYQPTIIVPGESTSGWQDMKSRAKETLEEYIDAAKSMHFPIPKLSKSPKVVQKPEADQLHPPGISPQILTPEKNITQILTEKNPAPSDVPKPPIANPAAQEFAKKHEEPERGEGDREKPVWNYRNSRILSEYIETTKGEDSYTQILSAMVEDQVRPVIRFISSLFHGISLLYITLTLLLFGVCIALAITLSNSGSPEFIFLKYYPKIGLLPVLTCLATLASMYIAHKIKDSSRQSWFLAVITLAVVPFYSSIALPPLAYPLIKIVAVSAGTFDKSFIIPSLSLSGLAQYFSVFLIFEIGLIVLLAYIKVFDQKPKPLGDNARTALAVIFILIFLPVSSVMGYGYWHATHTDFHLQEVRNKVTYHVYTPRSIPGNRTNATNYKSDQELADLYDAVSVTYDVPLPTLIQTGIHSPIDMKQVKILPEFNLEKFTTSVQRDSGTTAELIAVNGALNNLGFVTYRGGTTFVWFLMPEQILVSISSPTAEVSELLSVAESLK